MQRLPASTATLALILLAVSYWLPVPARAPVLTASVTQPFAIVNGQPRLALDGSVIDAHDGEIVEFNGTFYLYGTAYGCGFRWTDPTTPFCGFNVYSSADLSHWTGPQKLFQPTADWQNLCMHGSPAGWGCLRPHVVFNQATGQYVLWINVPGGYRSLTSSSPLGPFAVARTPGLTGGDLTLLVDTDGSGYVIHGDSGRIFENRLTADYLDVSGLSSEITGFPQVAPFYGAEAPSAFIRSGVYYLVLSVPQCPYCSGTGSGYFTSVSATGPWVYQGLFSDYSCDGQPAAVSPLDGVYLYQSDQWLQNENEYPASQFWAPLQFQGARILPAQCSVGAYPNRSFLSWYDNDSPGFTNDNIHIVNPAANQAVAVGAIGLQGQQLSFSIPPGQEWYGHFYAGTKGGPVEIGSNVPVVVSQRTEYYQSFNEVAAQSTSQAATDMTFPWFDRVSSPGFLNDNIHVVNPSPGDATVTVTIPGSPSCVQTATIASDSGAIFTCSTGFGGPVSVHASAPVLASQRLTYFQTFSETNANAGAGGTALVASWYDHASSALFHADNVHVVSAAVSLSTSNVNVSIPGCPAPDVWRYSASEWIYSCPFGQGFGGPVRVTASAPVQVTLRVQYGSSFNETPAQDVQKAAKSLSMPWFDRVSSGGFLNDNIHVVAPSGALNPSQVTVSIPGCTPAAWQAAPSELVYGCAFGHGFGGPVTVSSTVPVLASQRVQFYQSFNEANAAAG